MALPILWSCAPLGPGGSRAAAVWVSTEQCGSGWATWQESAVTCGLCFWEGVRQWVSGGCGARQVSGLSPVKHREEGEVANNVEEAGLYHCCCEKEGQEECEMVSWRCCLLPQAALRNVRCTRAAKVIQAWWRGIKAKRALEAKKKKKAELAKKNKGKR